jgi:hypothetical protein
MKKAAACTLLLLFAVEPVYAKQCFDEKIRQVYIGATNAESGGEFGNAIYVDTVTGNRFRVDSHYNLDDKPGAIMFSQLMQALRGGRAIVGFDNWNGQCDNINQITLKD